jgi:hypothetical protein
MVTEVDRKAAVTVAAEVTVTRSTIRDYLATRRARYDTLPRPRRGSCWKRSRR